VLARTVRAAQVFCAWFLVIAGHSAHACTRNTHVVAGARASVVAWCAVGHRVIRTRAGCAIALPRLLALGRQALDREAGHAASGLAHVPEGAQVTVVTWCTVRGKKILASPGRRVAAPQDLTRAWRRTVEEIRPDAVTTLAIVHPGALVRVVARRPIRRLGLHALPSGWVTMGLVALGRRRALAFLLPDALSRLARVVKRAPVRVIAWLPVRRWLVVAASDRVAQVLCAWVVVRAIKGHAWRALACLALLVTIAPVLVVAGCPILHYIEATPEGLVTGIAGARVVVRAHNRLARLALAVKAHVPLGARIVVVAGDGDGRVLTLP